MFIDHHGDYHNISSDDSVREIYEICEDNAFKKTTTLRLTIFME